MHKHFTFHPFSPYRAPDKRLYNMWEKATSNFEKEMVFTKLFDKNRLIRYNSLKSLTESSFISWLDLNSVYYPFDIMKIFLTYVDYKEPIRPVPIPIYDLQRVREVFDNFALSLISHTNRLFQKDDFSKEHYFGILDENISKFQCFFHYLLNLYIHEEEVQTDPSLTEIFSKLDKITIDSTPRTIESILTSEETIFNEIYKNLVYDNKLSMFSFANYKRTLSNNQLISPINKREVYLDWINKLKELIDLTSFMILRPDDTIPKQFLPINHSFGIIQCCINVFYYLKMLQIETNLINKNNKQSINVFNHLSKNQIFDILYYSSEDIINNFNIRGKL